MIIKILNSTDHSYMIYTALYKNIFPVTTQTCVWMEDTCLFKLGGADRSGVVISDDDKDMRAALIFNFYQRPQCYGDANY